MARTPPILLLLSPPTPDPIHILYSSINGLTVHSPSSPITLDPSSPSAKETMRVVGEDTFGRLMISSYSYKVISKYMYVLLFGPSC